MSKKDNLFWLDSGWQPVDIAFCPSKEAWNRARKRYRIDAEYPEIAGYGGRCQLFRNDETHTAIIVVWVSHSSERDAMEVISTIVHEAVHVWQFICQVIGETDAGMEIEAYSIQRITEMLIDAYCQTQGKDKVWNA